MPVTSCSGNNTKSNFSGHVIITMIIMAFSSKDTTSPTQSKTKLKIAYLIPWTGQFTPGMTMGPVILTASDNVKVRGLLSN